MKQGLMLLLAALLVAPLALAEASFFTEESFGASGFTGKETFFEESGFFAEDGFSGAAPEAAAVSEEAPEETEAEDRSLVMTYTDNQIYSTNPPAEAWMSPVYFQSGMAVPKKPNQVKLEWIHEDYTSAGFPPIKKLPKNVQYVIYELDQESALKTGSYAWIEVARTTKKSITLKNQIEGEHVYSIRAERIKGKAEEYGLLGHNEYYVTVYNSTMWKTIDRLWLRENTVSASSKAVYFSFVTKERAKSYKYSARYKVNGKWVTKEPELVTTGASTVYENGKVTFHYNDQLADSSVPLNATQYEVTVTPYEDSFGKGKAGKSKKASMKLFSGKETEDWKSAPVILSSVRTEGGITLTWKHDIKHPSDYYEIFDGKSLVQRCYAKKDPNAMRTAFIPLSSGKHTLKVRAVNNQHAQVKGAFSAGSAVIIPKPAEDYPIITSASITPSDGYIAVSWACSNPDIYQFYVYATDQYHSSEMTYGMGINGNNPYYTTPGTGDYPVVTIPGKQRSAGMYVDHLKESNNAKSPYFIIVQGVTSDGKVFTSDIMKYSIFAGTPFTSVIPLRR